MATDQDRVRNVEEFVRRHFTWPGTLHLHRSALGLDILRAPVNVLLSPVLVLARFAGFLCGLADARRLAGWLLDRRLLLRTAVAARVEAAILKELLDVPFPGGIVPRDRAGLTRAILAAPRHREAIRAKGSIAEAEGMAERITRALAEYTGSRSAMAELTTALITLAIGAIVFRALTPGMISIAPGVAEALSLSTAIADFPLGDRIGGLWYGVFPVGPSPRLILATILGLILLGSVVAAFAGTIADPVQVRLGLHRRRLIRLLDTLDAELGGVRDRSFVSREHVFVRLLDLTDAVLAFLRSFRG